MTKDIQDYVNNRVSRAELGSKMSKAYEWDKWQQEIPYINFPEHFAVKVTPPVAGAVVRFRVADKRCIEKGDISVYLDCYSELGAVWEPYWEIYPAADGDVSRYMMRDIDGLIAGLQEALEAREKGGGDEQRDA